MPETENTQEKITEPRLWRDNGWTAQVIKNDDDDGWAVAMTPDGQVEPALVGPWTMGRDKKNPKPLDVSAFNTLVKTAAEVLEYSGAFLQLYREEGWYLERTVHYVGRVGLDAVKKKILDDADGRRALWDRLQFSLDGEPDPWFEFDKARLDLRQFQPLAAEVPAQETA